VAQLALITAVNVIGGFTASINGVVTSDATIDDGAMIDRRRQPRRNAMTIVTRLGCRHMQGIFAGRNYTVMTNIAGGSHLRMIKRSYR